MRRQKKAVVATVGGCDRTVHLSQEYLLLTIIYEITTIKELVTKG